MKKILLLIFVFISMFGFSQSYTNDFESGNWLYYSNRCWGIGPNDSFYNTKVVGSSYFNRRGSNDVCETDNRANTAKLISPWINVSPGVLKFDHIFPFNVNNRKLDVFVIDQNNTEFLLSSFSYTTVDAIYDESILVDFVGIYKFKWQWSGVSGHNRAQIDNIIFPGVNVSDPTNNCVPILPPPPDDDNDGVPNNQDDYPNDPDRAFNIYYPAADTGTLAFEDLWPNYGDYDMNDLVIKYKFKIVVNGNNNIVEIFPTFTLIAKGAAYNNGFGFQFPNVPYNEIYSVEGQGNQNGYNINSNGTENGNSKATFIVFNESNDLLHNWNTIKNYATSPSYKFNMKITFNTNVTTLGELNILNWNPFIIVNGNRGHEIHLPDHLPTDMMNITLFGQADDDSGNGKYFKSKTNLPWALDIHGQFDYPVEKSDVSNAYLRFKDWVLSGGTLYKDWWSNQSGDYRNNSLIY